MATAMLAAPQILIMANAALGLFTELARAYSNHPDADADRRIALEGFLPEAERVHADVQAYRAIPKGEVTDAPPEPTSG